MQIKLSIVIIMSTVRYIARQTSRYFDEKFLFNINTEDPGVIFSLLCFTDRILNGS